MSMASELGRMTGAITFMKYAKGPREEYALPQQVSEHPGFGADKTIGDFMESANSNEPQEQLVEYTERDYGLIPSGYHSEDLQTPISFESLGKDLQGVINRYSGSQAPSSVRQLPSSVASQKMKFVG
jgi:hypothetical protein